MTLAFDLTFDYLCPFARIVHDNVVTALRGGADWDVTFRPYSLAQGHVEEGAADVWDSEDPLAESGVLALCAGLAVRDTQPDRFLDVHEALFDARHDDGADIKDRAVVEAALARGGADVAAVFAEVASGRPLVALAREHRAGVDEHGVWGVPTFITGTRAVFVRLLERAGGDAGLARTRIERIVALIDGSPDLHEFKQTVLPF
jgi:predicted DsbA family dithiol-disulfide isomerase